MYVSPLSIVTNLTQLIANKSLYVTVSGGDPTGGAVTQYIKIKLIYRIVDVP